MYYQEISLNDEIIRGLDKVINTIGYDPSKVEKKLYRPHFTREHAKERTSVETLQKLMQGEPVDVASYDCNLFKFNNINFDFLGPKIALAMKNEIDGYGLSGRIWYPKNGYMGWHTNHNNQGHKLYCAYAREGNKSFFRYRDPKTEEVITSWDKQGWNFRIFKVEKELLWHCVYSETDRFSIGYTLKKKPSEKSEG